MLGGKEGEPWFSGATMTAPTSTPRKNVRCSASGAIASLSGVAVLAIFMAQNTDDVTVHFRRDFTWPIWLLTLFAALVGALVWFGLVCCGVTGGVVRYAARPDGTEVPGHKPSRAGFVIRARNRRARRRASWAPPTR